MKLYQHVCLDKIQHKFENESCRIKETRSQGQILGKPCVPSRGHILSLVIIKLDQHVCFDEISHKFGNGSFQVKTLGHQVKF